jgi:hypothetical protein
MVIREIKVPHPHFPGFKGQVQALHGLFALHFGAFSQIIGHGGWAFSGR